MRKSFATAAAFLMLLSACTDDDASTTTTTTMSAADTTTPVTDTSMPETDTGISGVTAAFDPDSIQFVASLQRFDACFDVLTHFQTEAMARVGPYGLDGGGGFFPAPLAVEDSVDVARADTEGGFDTGEPATTVGSTEFREGVDFSGSNVQVAGVDEPDIIKTDGSRILAFANQTLAYVDVSSGTAQLMGTLFLPGWDHKFFMSDDVAIVFARGDGFAVPFAEESNIVPYGGPKTLVFQIDLSHPDELTVERTMHIDGNYLSARSIDGIVRIVVSAYPSDLPFVYPSSEAAEGTALETNKAVIASSTIGTWLPNYTLVIGTEGDVISEGLLVDCGQVHRPAEFAGFDTLAVLTVDMSDGLRAPDGTAVIAQGETVYASTDNLYVATNVWVPGETWGTDPVRRIEEDYSTAIHKFDISDGSATYRASGAVRGHLLNQFAMDEYLGDLRVATTEGPPWGFDDSSESFVTVLQERDGGLEQVGRVGDMGRGERIFSVRFIGETAYVVTFRQVDPFYVIDLSDAEAPKVVGELKIAGYSGYLHPVGEDRILGIGQDATEDGLTTGAKATMFDVSDPSNPRELGTWTMDGASSDVEWDHLAFLYWSPESLAVLPVQNWQQDFYGAVVLKTDDGVREIGRIIHTPDIAVRPESDCRELTLAELISIDPDIESEVGDGLIVQVCGEGEEVSGGTSYECESLSYDEAIVLAQEEDVDLTTIMDEGDSLVVCFPDFDFYGSYTPPVVRSLVIGDHIWTLSSEALQANSVDDVSPIQYIPLGSE